MEREEIDPSVAGEGNLVDSNRCRDVPICTVQSLSTCVPSGSPCAAFESASAKKRTVANHTGAFLGISLLNEINLALSLTG